MQSQNVRWTLAIAIGAGALRWCMAIEPPATRVYENRLTVIEAPSALFADSAEFVEPIRDVRHFEAPSLVVDSGADLSVRAWRFNYNARGIIETPNRLRASETAVVVVHPWGIDDDQGWRTPEPAGVAFFCTPIKNQTCTAHLHKIVNPFLKSLRGRVGLVLYSLPGKEDPIRAKCYRSFRRQPTDADRKQGARELRDRLGSFTYAGKPLPEQLTLSTETPVADYFKQFRGLDSGDHYNNAGFWQLPVPVHSQIEVAGSDVVIYDGEGYDALRQFLKSQRIRHVLLAGYCTDMCVKSTTAGYLNLSRDFNLFLVGDATLATFPACDSPRAATAAALAFASLDQLITQVSWVRLDSGSKVAGGLR